MITPRHLLSLALVCIITIACESNQLESKSNKEAIVTLEVQSNSTSLTSDRVTYKSEPLFNPEYDILTGVSLKSTATSTLLERGEMFVLIADIAAPIRSGERMLSATHVDVNENRAFVSYHYNEANSSPISQDLYEGQIDILDISDPSTPIIVSSATSDVADFNTMCLDFNSNSSEQKLWIGSTDYNVGGVIYELDLIDNDMSESSILKRHTAKESFSVNGVARASNYLFASGGRSSGGNYIFNAEDVSLIKRDSFPNAKYVATSGNNEGDKQVILISGNTAQLLIYSINENHDLLKTIDIGSIQPETGKSSIIIRDNLCWVAMGYSGLKAFDLETGEVVHTHAVEGFGSNAVTNSIAFDDDYIYVANGSGGMSICEVIDGQQELDVLETYNYGASANYINVVDDLIFIANGREGLKILRRIPKANFGAICEYDENGVPECVEQYDVCETLRSNLAAVLPSNQNAITTHPEYFNHPQFITLTEEASVYVSFIDEGAGFKSSFGTYIFDATTPPTSVDDISNKQLIYPNASKLNSGGGLIPGATVKTIGKYPAGTGIGGFLMAGGWVGKDKVEGGLREGYYTLYSHSILNTSQYEQSLIFYDQECQAILMTFEDIKISGGDRDFEDCVMQIIIEPAGAVDVSQFIQITGEE